ncbi:hypothetical protein AVEN_157825-1 [Araneus ventricosus]|uniref:Uncharacterized protein n=1 Tax=Araneus ventricosus TaxID=182803 RepID=A0A4Y2IMD0_ARAVE|nr:hypothetical protein AVEN_157825-1 [Araneus ventricosus]
MDWKFAMKMHLIKKDLQEYVDGSKEDPVKDIEALSCIVEEVSETILNVLRDLSSGKEAWKVLAETYEDKGIILANLPDRFVPLIMASKNCGEEITVDNVKNRLLAEDVKPQVDDSREHAFANEKFKGKKIF